jgi:hypothetical protein
MGLFTAVVGHDHGWMIAAGAVGPVIAAAYLLSPAWRLVIVVDEQALEVRRGADVRLRLPWNEIRRARVVPRFKVAFLDGGEPGKSLLLTGPGAPGPYRIERREALYDLVVARLPADKLQEVETLEG